MKKSKKLIYIAGTWDMFHIGHLNSLKECKKLGSKLIVGVSTDELAKSYRKDGPIIPFEQRLEIIKSCKYVDKVIKQKRLMEKEQLIDINPQIIVIGEDWKDKQLSGLEWFKKQKGKEVIYLARTSNISSTKLRKKLKELKFA
jgi:glycerol-3-phosphate cytidylyltransferase